MIKGMIERLDFVDRNLERQLERIECNDVPSSISSFIPNASGGGETPGFKTGCSLDPDHVSHHQYEIPAEKFDTLVIEYTTTVERIRPEILSRPADPLGGRARIKAMIAWLQRVAVSCSIKALHCGGKAQVEINDQWLGRIIIRAVVEGSSISVELFASEAVAEQVKPMIPEVRNRFKEEELDLVVELRMLEEEGQNKEHDSGETGDRPGILDLLA